MRVKPARSAATKTRASRSKKAHEVLKEQCEEFLFGSGAVQAPPDYVPEKPH